MLTVRERNAHLLLAALPGPDSHFGVSAKRLSAKTGLSVSTVGRYLRVWYREGTVDRCTKFYSSLSYTRLYWRTKDNAPEALVVPSCVKRLRPGHRQGPGAS